MTSDIRFLYNESYGVVTDGNGLYYMRARYYNSEIKRFINRDIKVGDIGSSQSLNRYAYCEGNPVSLVDPFGLSPNGTQDQGTVSKYQKWHNFLGAAGMFWDGFDVINAVLYAKEGDWVNVGISLACGLPAVGNGIAAVAKSAKLVKYVSAGAKIAKTCRDVGRIGNTAAGVKAVYDTYQEAQKFETTAQKAAYIAGTLIVGYAAGKAANWGAGKLKTAASKVMPRLKTALQEGAGELAGRISGGVASSGSGHMNRNRGCAVWPFGKGSIGSDELIHVYRGTDRYAEVSVFEETGHLLSDAARISYQETGNLEAAYAQAGAIHDSWLKIWGNENDFVQAHGAFGTELPDAFGLHRTFMSVTTDLDVARRFAGTEGRVFEAYIPKSQLIKQTLSGAGESEYLIRFGSGGFK